MRLTRTFRVAAAIGCLFACSVVTACHSGAPPSGPSGPSGSGSAAASGSGIATSAYAVTETAQPALVKQLPASVAASKTLTVGVALGSPPDEFRDANGQIAGWEVSMVSGVAQSLGLKLQLQPNSFDSMIPSLQAKRYDAAVGQFGVNTDREKVVDFVTTLNANEEFAAKKGSGITVKTLMDLCGRTVATSRGSVEYDYAQAQNPLCTKAGKKPIDVQVYNDGQQGGLAMVSGRADLFWLGATAVSYFVQTTNGQTEVVGEYLTPRPLGIAIQKNSGMTQPIQGAIQHMIADGTYTKIVQHWGVAKGAITDPQINAPIKKLT